MLIKKRVTTVEEVQFEISLPAYFKENNWRFYAMTEEGIFQVSNSMIYLMKAGGILYDKDVAETTAKEPSTEAEFLAAYADARMNLEYKLPQTA